MKEITLIFPNQLFENNPAIKRDVPVLIIEDPLFFGDKVYPLNFHKNKILLHRSSMKFYQDYLIRKGYNVHYIDYVSIKNNSKSNYLVEALKDLSVQKVNYIEPVDFILEKRIKIASQKLGISLSEHPSQMFLTPKSELINFFAGKKKYLMHSFYIHQRKRLNILIENDKPIGNRWSYDADNRKKLPKGILIPSPIQFEENEFTKEAKEYVEKYFSKNLGTTEFFNYPVTFSQARKSFLDFLENRFLNFGIYEDAIDKNNNTLFHSILSPALNIGLITPLEVINTTLEFARDNNIPINSLEGFIRQIIGWREYIRAIYEIEGVRQRNSNFFELENNLSNSFYDATTGIEPIDDTIKKLLSTAFTHHIERLMILGNYMLLSEIHPNEVYRWFMEMFIDAYDWVMVPNVYGMSQFADGGLICTKPYISSSNYILKMSNYRKGEWCKVWDEMYWSFLRKNRGKLISNQRMALILKLAGER
ncbi:MAG: cryptochrome/photolyase family protein [Ignavibacterium sp.]|nr:cryptochrome/photolyase family protein [Ignavibacterium sp.]MDW8374699.1 cryptochrome/photolyase family protein [Ignavibacteriales bacterium]